MSDLKNKARSSSIILDLSIKKALERRGEVQPSQDVILPWWFKRECTPVRSKETQQAYAFVMRWLNENAPEQAENVYCEADDTQNIVINPMYLIEPTIQAAFLDAGFRLITEDELPDKEKSDVWERIKAGSNFSDQWH